MVSHDPVSLTYLLDLFAHLYQRPGQQHGGIPQLKSLPGSGKRLWISPIKHGIGSGKCITTNNVAYVFGTYDEAQENSILIDLDDASTKDMYTYAEAIKHAATDGQFGTTIRRMHTAPEKGVKVFPRIIQKGQNNANVAEADRRYFVMNVSNEKIGDDTWNAETAALLENNDESAVAIYQYLLARDISAMLKKPPVTDAGLLMGSVNIPPLIRLLGCIALGPTDTDVHIDDRVKVSGSEFAKFYTRFWEQNYKKESRQSCPVDARTISSDMIKLSKDIMTVNGLPITSGIESVRYRLHATNKQLRGYKIDRVQLKVYLDHRYKLSQIAELDMMEVDNEIWSDWQYVEAQPQWFISSI